MSNKPVSSRRIEIDCPKAGKTITAILSKYEPRESRTGKHSVIRTWESPTDCSGKKACKYWAAPMHCPLFQPSEPAIAQFSET
jgi:hypothetical protein